MIEAANGKDVSGYTNYPNENEAILCPGTRLRIVSNPLDQPPMHLVHLKEVTDDTEQELATSFSGMAMEPSPVQIHTDQWGNRYEITIHILYRLSYYYRVSMIHENRIRE